MACGSIIRHHMQGDRSQLDWKVTAAVCPAGWPISHGCNGSNLNDSRRLHPLIVFGNAVETARSKSCQWESAEARPRLFGPSQCMLTTPVGPGLQLECFQWKSCRSKVDAHTLLQGGAFLCQHMTTGQYLSSVQVPCCSLVFSCRAPTTSCSVRWLVIEAKR